MAQIRCKVHDCPTYPAFREVIHRQPDGSTRITHDAVWACKRHHETVAERNAGDEWNPRSW